MEWSLGFVMQSILLGVGLAMDAFSVSLANGLNEPGIKVRKMCLIAGVFAFFQALMPLMGWFCVHNLVKIFSVFEPFIPWIAFVLLAIIGGKMLAEGIKNKQENACACGTGIGFKLLLVQGVATSIDALSVGFTISSYGFLMAVICALIIAAVTFVICMAGVYIGKIFGTTLACKASMLGGVILILIGLEILISGIQ